MSPADVPDTVALFWCNLLVSMMLATLVVTGVHAWRLSRRDNEQDQ